jgi:hypothetical protein
MKFLVVILASCTAVMAQLPIIVRPLPNLPHRQN